MATRDLRSNVTAYQSVPAQTPTSDVTGTGVDTKGYQSVMVVALVGAEGDTLSGSIYGELELEESSDNSTYTDVGIADMLGETGTTGGVWCTYNIAADANKTYTVSYIGSLRYVRVLVDLTGTHSTGTPVAAAVLLGHPDHAPATVQNANV